MHPEEKRILSTHGFRSRSELHERVVAAFASQAEVCAIHVFGREVEGGTDEYSDIDLIVSSADLARSQSRCWDVLESISPIIGTYCIAMEPRTLAQMVMFRDYSPYQKIDFSITDDPAARNAFGPCACLYERCAPTTPSATCIQLTGEREALGNWLNDVLFSIPRFTKCLFRGDRDLYRRWTGAIEHLAVMLYESCFGWDSGHRYRLGPHEYKALHKRLSADQAALLERIQPMNGRPDLVLGYELAVGAIIDLCRDKARSLGEPVDLAFAEYMRRFLCNEIRRFALCRCSERNTRTDSC
jgi:predicted nucleotidyltransferase